MYIRKIGYFDEIEINIKKMLHFSKDNNVLELIEQILQPLTSMKKIVRGGTLVSIIVESLISI